MRILATAILAVAGGLVLAFAVIMLTPYPFMTLGGPVDAVTTQRGHIDYWTGEVAPTILSVFDGNGQVVTTYVIPEDYQSHRVIPLPVAFAVGSLLTLGLISIVGRRRVAPTQARRTS